jgi:hypothetical protein
LFDGSPDHRRATERAKIPVPKVHLYCTAQDNPVKAAWILMDYMPGKELRGCFNDFDANQTTQLAADLAHVVSQLFSITSNFCGSLIRDFSLTGDQVPPRYEMPNLDPDSMVLAYSKHAEGKFLIGPIYETPFLDVNFKVPAKSFGPFDSERKYLEAIAVHKMPARTSDNLSDEVFKNILKIYDVVRPLYRHTPKDNRTFHFAHAYLNPLNILVNPETGAVTGILDWEMSGFRPAWLSATAPSCFDDDSRRFVVYKDGPYGYGEETEGDIKLIEDFRSKLNRDLSTHSWEGVELRAIFHNLCKELPENAAAWLECYQQRGWDEATRGPFPDLN